LAEVMETYNSAEEYESQVDEAARCYLARRARTEHPDGTYDGHRWYSAERCACCERIRKPSRRYPWSEMRHCRTIRHVACLYGVEEGDLRERAREIRATM